MPSYMPGVNKPSSIGSPFLEIITEENPFGRCNTPLPGCNAPYPRKLLLLHPLDTNEFKPENPRLIMPAFLIKSLLDMLIAVLLIHNNGFRIYVGFFNLPPW